MYAAQSRKEQSRETQRIIVEAASVLFSQKNIDEVNTTMIAKKAGVGVGTLYHYFPNKSDILGRVIESLANKEIETVRNIFQQRAHDSIVDVFSEVVDAMVDFHVKELQLHALVAKEFGKVTDAAAIRHLEKQAIDLVRRELKRRQKEIPHIDPEHASFIIVITIEKVIRTSLEFDPLLITESGLRVELHRLIRQYLGKEITHDR